MDDEDAGVAGKGGEDGKEEEEEEKEGLFGANVVVMLFQINYFEKERVITFA